MNKVAVIYGGRSSEHEVSRLSAEHILSAVEALEDWEAVPVYITKEGRWLLRESVPAVLSPDPTHKGLLINNRDIISIDAVFPALHGKNGEDGSIQGLCQLAGIPCVGPGILSSALCMDKDCARRLVSEIPGVVSTPYLVFSDTDDVETAARKAGTELGWPCFIKPANAGSSLGVTKAVDESSFTEAFRLAAVHDRKVLAEKAVVGRELETGVLGNEDITVAAVGEILAAADFYDYDSKYHNPESTVIIPAEIPESVSGEIRRQAGEIYKALGCSGMARVDFFLEDGTGRVIFNEVNTIPGFTSISMYPKLFAELGPGLVGKLLELAVAAMRIFMIS